MLKFIRKFFYYLFYFPFYKMQLGALGIRSRLIFPTFSGAKNIFIGNKVFIQKNAWLGATAIEENMHPSLRIEDGTYIGHFAHIYATKRIHIEGNVLIANNVYISDNQHQYQDVHLPIIQQGIKQLNEVIIKSGAWIGENVCIMGASIGKNSVVGANSIVTKDVPDYCIAVGAPAKIVKRYNFKNKAWCKTNENGDFANE